MASFVAGAQHSTTHPPDSEPAEGAACRPLWMVIMRVVSPRFPSASHACRRTIAGSCLSRLPAPRARTGANEELCAALARPVN